MLNKPYYFLTGLLLLSLSLVGCSGKQPKTSQVAAGNKQSISIQPEWVHNPPRRAGYAYGVASSEIYGSEARALETAKDKAKADLLASIRVEISSSTDYSKNATMQFQGDMTLQENLNQKISSKTPAVELSGIKTTETWVNEQGKETWALAELDTQAAARQLLTELAQLEERLLKRGALPDANKLDRVRYLKPSLQELVERQQLLQQLTFLGAATQADAARKQKVEQLEVEIAKLMASLSIQLQAVTSEAKALTPLLASALTDLGFNLVNSQPDLRLVLELKTSQVKRGNGLVYVDASSSGKINTAKNRTLHVINASTRAVSSEASVANNKAVTELAEKLADSLIESLYQNL
ncbi:LPP20 family lipoprotein [Marinospirillum insulare]|uniref:Lipoprotein LPP20-like domain-containing protein n=1 Tax=Marinospirillum insulare TaxID=217169 RepID=A0ABQ5ZYS5_9GAMM|nr:LPP20 family lipoprotein [Marinospirillum insulare]GLR63487.1 hypothetical protein GCM10007878_09220 [Marinospirillum insulare]